MLRADFPRIRGDVPTIIDIMQVLLAFSPHTRGCSRLRVRRQLRHLIFPAYAGMFRFSMMRKHCLKHFPRIRGDVPQPAITAPDALRFSPHTRGCSVYKNAWRMPHCIFPAYAGMFRMRLRSRSVWANFPRIRGDVPEAWKGMGLAQKFSPHTRGCSFSRRPNDRANSIFPAYAGMFRLLANNLGTGDNFPRIRGDVPVSAGQPTPTPEFSPHTRGCS